MNEIDVRQVLLVRAVESAPVDERAQAWHVEDAAWASAEARRRVGEHAAADTYLAARAGLALQRLGERDAAWRDDAWRPARGVVAAVLLVAGLVLAVAIVGNVFGPERRINLLAPPVLALLLWNIVVYGLLAVAALSRARADSEMPTLAAGWAAIARGAARFTLRSAAAPVAAARLRQVAAWSRLSAPLQAQRFAATMHLAAALLAGCVVLSMYVVGIALDFRAGWDSTWLEAAQVQRVLHTAFGPAAAIAGIDLPDAQALARLRWADGSAGESAARWIHLYALTLAGAVIVPRLSLAALAAWRARRAARQLRLPLDEPYFRQLLDELPARSRLVTVLPYSYRVGDDEARALPRVLAEALGRGAAPRLLPSLPLGAEDDLMGTLTADTGDHIALLFTASATPERESHGAIAQRLGQHRPGAALTVLIDESGLRRQYGPGSDGTQRLRQRREAWQRMLQSLSLPAPVFIDLGGRGP